MDYKGAGFPLPGEHSLMRSSLLTAGLLAAALALSACSACTGDPPPDVGSPALVEAPLAETTVGAGYSAVISANGGKAPYTFSAQGLPSGISLASDTGRLSGTASQAGDFQVQVTLKDSSGKQDSKSFALKVYPGVYFKQNALPGATAQSPYSVQLELDGGKAPLTLKVSAGDLPPGVTLNSATRRLEGTFPSAGTLSLTIEATDVHGSKATQPYTLAVAEPLRVSATLPPGNVGLLYSQGITSSGGRAPLTLAITNGVLPPGLELSGGVISGTPTAGGRFTFTVGLTDANGAVASAVVTLDIFSHLPPQFPAATLASGIIGREYSELLLGAEGAPPYTFAITSGSLPAGLSLSAAGVISGTPTTAETQSFQVTLTDSQGQRAQRSFTLSIHPLLVVQTTSLAEGYQGQFYNQTLAASGGRAPYRWEAQGTLPAGLTLTLNGFLSGSPTVAGTYGLVFNVTDASGQLATVALQLILYTLPAITNTALADGAVGVPYNQRLRASGGKSPYTFAITGGVLPPGLQLTGDTIHGTPTGAVTSNLTFRVADANGRSSSRDLDLRIFNGLTITTGTLDDSYVGRSYAMTLTAVGGDISQPYRWTAIGALPAGLTLSPSGVISGTATTAGTTRFTAQVTDNSNASTSRVFDLRVLAPPSVTTTSLPEAYVDAAYSTTLGGAGGLPPYQWRVSSGTLPAGVTLSSGGVLSGIPTTAGTSTFTVELSDSNNVRTTANLSLTASVLTITSASMAEGYTGQPYTHALTASGGPAPFTWNVTGLPSGFSYDTSTGVVSGTPVATGTTSISVRVTDALNRVATRGLSLIVYAPPQITTSALAHGFSNAAYNQLLEAINGKPPYTWSITAGTLHAGLALNSSAGTWTISGTPTEFGTRTLTFRVTDANGKTASRSLDLTIYAPLVLSTTTLPDAYAGRPYDQSLTATGGRTPYTFDRSGGALPGGLSLSPTGRISGDVAAGATNSTFTARVVDANSTQATQSLSIAVYPVPAIVTTSYPEAYTGDPLNAPTVATGGKAPLTWTVASGSLPAGVTLNATSGGLTGVPTQAGTFSFTLKVSDANGQEATQALQQIIHTPPTLTSPPVLPGAYAGQPYTAAVTATGGKAPLVLSLASGTLPSGLSFEPTGNIHGTAAASIAHGTRSTFTLRVTDANGRMANGPFEITTYKLPEITSIALTTATEGVSYRRSEASPERIDAQFGQGALTYTASGLPAGLSINTSTGELTGIPTQEAAGGYTIAFTVTDAGSRSFSATLPLLVVEPQPANFGGAVGLAPAGSRITDTLTVFTVNGRTPLPGVGVRVRKNGQEYSPAMQALTNAEGKVVFTGLGLNGTTDTVDITANGAELVNTTIANVNSAIVTVHMTANPVLGPRVSSGSAYDPPSQRFLLYGGNDSSASNSLFYASCMSDVVEAVDITQRSFTTRVPGGLTTSPSPRYETSMATAGGVAVLFGGRTCTDTGDSLGDTWEYSLSTNTWTQVSPSTRPSPRRGAAMVREPFGNSVLMVGGYRNPSHSNEVWRYTPSNDTWTLVGTAPFSRSWMAATANTNTGELWFCGGRGSFPGDACHSLNPSTMAWTPRPSLPTSLSEMGMAFDPFTNNLYVFGGRSNTSPASELLLLRSGATAWEQVTPSGSTPPSRYGHLMYFDLARRELVVGAGMVVATQTETGRSYRRRGDVWTYNGSTWTQRGPITPTLPSHTVSGEVINGPFPGYVELRLVTSSGFSASTIANIDNSGTGTYAFNGVPPGEAGLITVVGRNEDLPFPNDTWSYTEVELTPLTADRLIDITLPFGPAPVLQASGQYQLPASWRGYAETVFSAPELDAPGLPYVPNGTSDPEVFGPQFSVAYFPTAAPKVQRLDTYLASPLPCEDHGIYKIIPPGNQDIAVGANVTGLTPGQPECIPAGTRGVGTARSRISSFAPERPAVDDLDGDTFPDLVIPSLQSAGFEVVWGNPSTSFLFTENDCCDVDTTHSVVTGDFNRDGRKDVAFTEANSGTLKVKMARADAPRAFGPAAAYTVGLRASGIAVADVTQDTLLDLLVGNPDNNTVQLFRGQSGGTFAAPQTITLAGTGPKAVVVANVGGTSRPDLLVVVNEGLSLALDGNTQGPFGTSTLLTAGSQPSGVVVGRLNNDALDDIAVSNAGSNNVTVYLARTGGGFTGPTHFDAGTAPAGIVLAELTGDANADLAVASSGDGTVTLLQGSSTGTFSTYSRVPVSGSPRGIVAVDFNQDGLTDLLTNVTTNHGIAVLLGRTPLPTSAGTTFSFTAPTQSGFMTSYHRINGHRRFWEYYSPLQAGPVSYSLPLASTLAPSAAPVAPASGKVELTWTPWVRKWEPGSAHPFNPRQFSLANLGMDSDTQPGASHYLWP
jgi:hypothetical protein